MTTTFKGVIRVAIILLIVRGFLGIQLYPWHVVVAVLCVAFIMWLNGDFPGAD